MSMSASYGRPKVPASVADLDLADVVEALSLHACNVSDAAAELHVPSSDLRRLLWSNPQLQDAAFEVVEARIDLAEKNIVEALHSEDLRFRMAASMFTLRNSIRAKRRGWITSSVAAAEVNINLPPQETQFVWRSGNPAEAAAEEEKVARLTAEGKKVIQVSWGEPQERGEDDDANTFVRDEVRLPLPRYGRGGDEAIEGELAHRSPIIETGSAEELVVVPEPMPELEPAPALPALPALPDHLVRYERERIDAWIRNRLVDYPLAACLRCRKPIIAGQDWQEVSNGEARARFHRTCHAEWRIEREGAARQALGLSG